MLFKRNTEKWKEKNKILLQEYRQVGKYIVHTVWEDLKKNWRQKMKDKERNGDSER